MIWLCQGWGWQPPQTASHIHIGHIQSDWEHWSLICYPWAYRISLTQLYPYNLGQILGFWVTCGVKMMWLCYGWGCQPPQTASHNHVRHTHSVWAHWYAVHWYTVADLHSFTQPTSWVRFWGTWSLVESKWCIFVKVDADSHLKLLPTYILDIYKVIKHIDMLSMGIQYQPYTVIPTVLGADFGALGHLWSQNDVIMSWLRLTATSNCFPHPYKTFTAYLSTLTYCPLAYGSSLTQFYSPYLAQILGFWVTCGVKMMWLCHGWGWQPPQTAYHIHIRHVQSVWAHWYAVHIHTISALHSYIHPTSSLLGSDFGVRGHLWSKNDSFSARLMLVTTSNCFPPPY